MQVTGSMFGALAHSHLALTFLASVTMRAAPAPYLKACPHWDAGQVTEGRINRHVSWRAAQQYSNENCTFFPLQAVYVALFAIVDFPL